MKRQKNKRTLRQKHGTHQRQATRQEAIVTPLKFDTQQFLGSRADIEAVSLERRPGLVGMKAWACPRASSIYRNRGFAPEKPKAKPP